MHTTTTILSLLITAITCLSVVQADEIVSIKPLFNSEYVTHWKSQHNIWNKGYHLVPIRVLEENRHVRIGETLQIAVELANNSNFNDTSIILSLEKPRILGWEAVDISYGSYSVSEMIDFVRQQGKDTLKSRTVLILTCPVPTQARVSNYYKMKAEVYHSGSVRRVFDSADIAIDKSVHPEVDSKESTCHFTLSN